MIPVIAFTKIIDVALSGTNLDCVTVVDWTTIAYVYMLPDTILIITKVIRMKYVGLSRNARDTVKFNVYDVDLHIRRMMICFFSS